MKKNMQTIDGNTAATHVAYGMSKDVGKNPFILDSKAPDGSLQEFLSGENRFAALEKSFPEESRRLRSKIEKEAQERYQALKKMADDGV